MESITLTPAQLTAIASELGEKYAWPTRELRVRAINGSTVIVTLDGGYGTSSFYVNRNGRTWQAGLGESADTVTAEVES